MEDTYLSVYQKSVFNLGVGGETVARPERDRTYVITLRPNGVTVE